ncbi:MAG: carbamoyl-phosphate synthase (glutamine-hydrolyzing) large subunit, partial [Chloroflexi bacterium]|nr:carbamoyl-phosphate synthase (glutamine-hydrolyzing) large subunit [Chloroflexota bacterium]
MDPTRRGEISQKPDKVLVIGSGPIVIGQAAEFDYAGTQACKALREEGVTTVLVNSNPATIMTDQGIADRVYIEPLTVQVLERIIARERPDGILPTLGGQTGLNLAVALADAGVLDKYQVRLLGTQLDTIRTSEDRSLFSRFLQDIGEPAPLSATASTIAEAHDLARELGLPLIVRPAYTLGGSGGGLAETWDEFDATVRGGLAASPISQVLLERSLVGWKEIEYEVMRDGADNCITVCNMENLDPMGVHTGDSIVVAPSQTLTDKEYQMLRSASLKIIRRLGIEGGCNVQFALQPNPQVAETIGLEWQDPSPYYVIEVNPRVSRSSALASKATGYPIARVAAKIAVGKRLDEIPNAVTDRTKAAFEPTLDYCVVKIPRWPFDKFPDGDRRITTQMKSTGEVMVIDRSFEAAMQKAARALELSGRTLLWEDPAWRSGGASLLDRLPLGPNDLRIWAIMAALRRDVDDSVLTSRTLIDPWFISALARIVGMERRLLAEPLTPDLLLRAKRMGFSDVQVGTLADMLPEQVRDLRHRWDLRPVYKTVDTCAAEFEAVTPYYYSTYDQENEALPLPGKKAVIIGSGPIRIGQGIEFDYCSVHAAWALSQAGVGSIMINSNPETVSTDFDSSDRLYFEPLDEEAVRDIIENETVDDQPPPSVVQFGGQTAIDLSQALARAGLPILGSSAEAIDIASDRHKFEEFLARLGIPQPPGAAVSSVTEALQVAQNIGYPVVVRPSYVLGGRAMEIVQNASDLIRYITMAADLAPEKPVLIDRYMEGKECEVDAVCDGELVLIPGIMEHIERAGVHSGDSMAIYPGLNLSEEDLDSTPNFADLPGMAPFVRMVEEVTRTGEAIDRSEVMLGETALAMKEIGVSVAPLPGAAEYNGSVLLFSNMTDRRRLERAADLNKQLLSLGELAAGVVHQLRNPLTIITGRAELLLRQLEDPSEKSSAESILHEAEIIANSIATFLRFAKPFEFRPRRCEGAHVFDWAVQRCRGYAEEKGVTIVRVPPDDLELLHLDAERCGEAVGNILLNAVDAVEENGRVELSARQERGMTIFRVVDDGPGVMVADGEDVFSPFFTTKRDGTGLGLSIAQRIA